MYDTIYDTIRYKYIDIQIYIYIYIYIYITCSVYIYISNEKHFCGWDDTREALTQLYFHCGLFKKMKIKVSNLKRAKTAVLKIWEYNTRHILVRIIILRLK